MGWKSTIDMTRAEMEAAVRAANLESVPDEALAAALEYLRDDCHNYRVVETPNA